MNTTPLRAVGAAHAAAAVAPTPEGATPAITASAPLIFAAAVAPAPLGSAPVLRISTPVVRVVVVVPWEAGMGLAGPRVESSSLISSKDPVDENSARRRSSLGDPLPPENGEPGSIPSRRPTRMGTAHANVPLLVDKPEHQFKKRVCSRTKGAIRGQNKGDKQSIARPSRRL
eukprot:CAMPEP_0172644808 /NCGR_PEP_ID=MMETSP1068-20121228/239406_1 /TAXON_ID=35684 /ORGANISM="Pseudopedinella elastica, Strain CCMP716" /LENGTH=171 /DNA_ID=CAMNT_0013459023 /DNA_START=242 /DNA_END=754 /DNA_ORIENTATION=-